VLLSSEAQGYIGRFGGADTARVEQQRASQERYKAERTSGNGSRYYTCEFRCRTSGFLTPDGTGKMKALVKADEEWQARDKAEKQAKELCGNIRGTEGFHKGESMYYTGMSCEEKR